jgi:hypothetical protein
MSCLIPAMPDVYSMVDPARKTASEGGMRDNGRYFVPPLGFEQYRQQHQSQSDACGLLQNEASWLKQTLRGALQSAGGERSLPESNFRRFLPPFSIDHGQHQPDGRSHHHGPGELDSRKSVADLIGEGRMRRYGSQRSADHCLSDGLFMEPLESLHRRAERPPSVSVMFGDASRSTSREHNDANFEIGKFGRIKVLNDPELNQSKEIRIKIDREAGQLFATPRQQHSLNQLLGYLGDRIRRHFGAACDNGIRLDDQQGLSDGDGRSGSGRKFSRNDRFHSETEDQIHRMNRFDGAGHGRLSRREVDDYFSRRTVPQQRDESKSVMAAKEAMSALFNPDRRSPYDTLRPGLSGGLEVGRYGLTADHLNGWLSKNIGLPPDWQKIQTLANEGKVSPRFADQFQNPNFAGEFLGFVDNLRTGQQPISRLDMRRFLPKELQEAVMTDIVSDFARQCRGDMGAIALSYRLGRSPEQLSAADINDPRNQSYARSAQRLYGLAQSRQMSTPDSPLEYSCDRSELGQRLAAEAVRTARQMDSIGWCARGVKRTLRRFGVDGIEGHAADTKEFFDRDRRFQRVDINHLQPGDIVVRGRSRGHRYGHVLVYLGNGMEASDHVQRLSKAAKYGGSWAYRMVST